MKFKDVKTLESILLEYGMKPGSSTPTSQQQTGANAKASKVNSPTTTSTPKKQDAGSPTLGQTPDIEKIPEPKQQNARDIEKGAVVVGQDKKNKKVISPVGDGDIPDAMVVQDDDGEYEVIDQNTNIDAYDPEDVEQMQTTSSGPGLLSKVKGNASKGGAAVDKIANLMSFESTDVEEGKIAKKVHKKALNKLKPQVTRGKSKVKRLARLSLHEAPQKLFEINFRKKEIINSSLDAQIRCGWEAESLWEDLEEQNDDVDNMSIQEVDDNFGGVDWDSISENFTDWIYEYKQEEYMDDAIREFVSDREDDEDYINEFIEHEGIEEADWSSHREDILRSEYGDERFEEEGAEELSELYGYEDENWAREYVDNERRGDLQTYLEEIAADDDDVRQAAYEEASENYDYDDWISDQWYGMSSFCEDYGIDISTHGSISEVADRLEKFISEKSAFHDHLPEHGQYGDTSGSTTEYAVETDSSIDGYGTGAEIISPVFSTPRRMLAEMEKFFEWFQSEGVATNNSTGLHITMSYNPQEGETVNHEEGSSIVTANKVKMAVLLGDQYLLSEWGRSGNNYTKSQLESLKKVIQKLKVEGKGTDAIKNAEKFLADNISEDKFRSIHFKGQTDSKTNTKLIEFRIGGGEDYHMEFKKVFSSVVRYATTMIAGHTDQYEGDYVKALSRLLNKMNEVSTRDEEEVENLKSSAEDYAGHPILDSHKAISSAKNYLDFVSTMLASMALLNDAKKYLEPDADKKWKAKWTEYLDNTSDDLEDFDSSLRRSLNKITENINEVKTERSIKAYVRPAMRPPSETAVNVRNQGIRQFAEAMGMLALDIHNGKARSQPNAKSIGALRNFLKINEISESDVDTNMKMAMEDLNFNSDLSPKAKIDIIRKGIETLFKKDIIVKPDYITAPQVEALIKGLWNVFNAEGFNSREADKVKKLCVKLRLGDNTANVEQKEIEVDIGRMIDEAINRREFNDFYNLLTKSGYNNVTYLVAPGHIYDKNAYKELITFAKQSTSYTEPVSRSHNPNIYNDDSYEENALSKYTLLLRRRFSFLEDQHDNDVSVARKSLLEMVPLIETYFKDNEVNRDENGNMSFETIVGIPEEEIRKIEPVDPRVKKMSEEDKETYLELYNEDDNEHYLGVRSYKMERIQNALDNIVKGETERRTVSAMSEFITDTIRDSLSSYYKNKDRYPRYYVIPEIKSLIKQRFESLATFMRGIDKVFVDNGFESQDTSIKRKQQLDTDAKAFRKKMADKPLATVNIPSHSWTYINPRLWNEIEALAEAEEKMQPESTLLKQVIQSAQAVGQYETSIIMDGGGIIVVPAAHWSQAQDAINGKDIIKIQQKFGNNSQTWRLNNYNKIIDEFRRIYKIHPNKLLGVDSDPGWYQLDGRDRDLVSKIFRVEFTGKLDGRAGMGDVDELLPNEEAKNQVSGEPLEKNSAVSWSISDGNEKKQFAAYDWKKYHGKDADALKKAVADEMKNGIGFYKAIEKAIEDKNPSIKIDRDLVNAAGVEDYVENSSNTIAQKTNWTNLAMFLKIEPGVNNQGIGLLKKTYQMYDGNSSGAFAAEGHSIDRWVDAVKKSAKYIETNYTEGGGNYFRKDDPEGQPSGASPRYSYNDAGTTRGRASGPTTDELQADGVTEQDYVQMRNKYMQFDTMMQSGMQQYIVQTDVNRLVDFLKNTDNDEDFKKAVMNKMILDQIAGDEPNDFQGALARGRQYLAQNESVFAKFDGLPLQEQLRIVTQSKVLEDLESGHHKFKVSYKDGTTKEVIAKNPYGVRRKLGDGEALSKKELGVKSIKKISQPGRKPKGSFGFNNKGFTKGQRDLKKIKDKEFEKDPESYVHKVEESVPTIKTTKILNDLLADHFPVSDLRKQMLAFQAIPIPSMLDNFRELRAEAGDDACARGIVRHYVNALPKEQQDQIDLHEWAKSRVRSLVESKGIMGRVLGDRFQKENDVLEFQSVNLYPTEEMEFDSPEQRDDFIQQLEQELNSQIEWTNVPNKGSLAFGVAVLTDPALEDKITYWGRYFRQKTTDMMGKWSNSQVPQGWKLQTAGAMKLDIGIDPQHLIKTDDPFNGVIDVIQAVKTNSAGNELSESLINALETIHTQEHPVFPGQINNLPALRDYFGEIMGPVALMSEMVGGQADNAKADLLKGLPWSNCTVFWPMAMNAPLVDSYFTAPDGTRVGISSKGGKGAKASVKNIQDAILKAPQELKAQYPITVNVINIVQSNSAKDGPFRLAELYKILPQGLEEEINRYIQEGKQDYAGLSPACTELFNYGTPRQDVPGFNTGYAMLALLAKKVTRAINTSGPEFGQGCVAFLNQSSIVQLYCKMGKMGDDARVTGWEAVYPPNFQGTVEIDGSKNYYSSRIGGKFAFGFK